MSEHADQHSLVAFIKDLAIELGRTPRKHECANKLAGFEYRVTKHFGSFSTLIQAAGLEPNEGSRVKISNKIFERDIETHLEAYQPREVVKPQGHTPTIAAISDIHWPFHSSRVVSRFIEFVGDTRPEVVLINGDAWDMYSHAKFPRSHNVFTPREEQARARTENEKFWQEIQRISPQSKCYQLLGNHDVRPMKRILEAYPEAEDWVRDKLKELFTFEKVTTIHDAREELIFGTIAIHHGYKSRLGEHRDHMLMNSINGHTHVGGVVFRRLRGETLWELNCGLAGDPEAKGLTYTSQKITNWTPGFGAVDNLGPRFIAL